MGKRKGGSGCSKKSQCQEQLDPVDLREETDAEI